MLKSYGGKAWLSEKKGYIIDEPRTKTHNQTEKTSMKSNTLTVEETRDHVKNPWNYEDETKKIYTGQDMAEIIRDAEQTAESAAVIDLVRAFLALNTDNDAAIDLFAAAAGFRYNVTPKKA